WAHIDPVAQAFADNLASSYLRPAAIEQNIPNAEMVVVGYDPTAILANPDGFKDALDLYNARAVGKKFLRAAGNAAETDKMTAHEIAESLFDSTHIQVEVKNGAIVQEPAAKIPNITPVPPIGATGPSGATAPNGNGPPTGQTTPRDMPAQPAGMEQS